jgi:hypothetical protein
VQRLQVKLIVGFDRNEAHVVAIHRFGNRLGIEKVVLVRLYKRLHKLRRDQLHIVALRSQGTTQKVRPRTCLHPYQRRLKVRSGCDQLLLVELLPDEHLAVIAECHEVKGRLAKVNTCRANLHIDDPPWTCLQDPPHSGEVQAADHLSSRGYGAPESGSRPILSLTAATIRCREPR